MDFLKKLGLRTMVGVTFAVTEFFGFALNLLVACAVMVCGVLAANAVGTLGNVVGIGVLFAGSCLGRRGIKVANNIIDDGKDAVLDWVNSRLERIEARRLEREKNAEIDPAEIKNEELPRECIEERNDADKKKTDGRVKRNVEPKGPIVVMEEVENKKEREMEAGGVA